MTTWRQRRANAYPQITRRLALFAWWASTALLLGELSSAPASATPDDNRHIRVAQIFGANAKAKPRAGAERPLRPGEDLAKGDTIITGERTVVRLALYDGSLLNVGQNSVLALSDFRGEPKAMVQWIMRLEQGAVHGAVTNKETQKPKESQGVKLTIESPIAAMGVRGTKFLYTHSGTTAKDVTEIMTQEGEVLFAGDRRFRPGDTVEVAARKRARYEAGAGKPSAPVELDERDLQSALEKHGFLLAAESRAPQSTRAPTATDEGAQLPRNVSPDVCISYKLGWRQAPGTNAPIGDCY